VAFGLGAGSLAAGTLTGLLALHRKTVVDAHCGADKACDPIGFEAASAGGDLVAASAITLATGVFCTALGVYLLGATHAAPRSPVSSLPSTPFMALVRF
jgi:hypothetical protein